MTQLKLLSAKTKIAMKMLLLLATGVFMSVARAEIVEINVPSEVRFEYAGYYVALAKGFYANEGLDVQINSHVGYLEILERVQKGSFGVIGNRYVAEKAKSRPVLSLLSVFQHSPYVLVERESGHWSGLKDRSAKTVMLLPYNIEALAYLTKIGVNQNNLIDFNNEGTVEDLVSNKADVVEVYYPKYKKELGVTNSGFKIHVAKDEGIDFYGDAFIVGIKKATSSPLLVDKVKQASLLGWKYAFDHPEEAARILRTSYKAQSSEENLVEEARYLKELTQYEILDMGYSSDRRWSDISEKIFSLGLIDKPITIYDLVFKDPDYDLYTKYVKIVLALLSLIVAGSIIIFRFVKLNKALKRSENLWMFAMEKTGDGLWDWDLRTGKVSVSEGWKALMGFANQDVTDRLINWRNFIHPEDLPHVEKTIAECLKGNLETYDVDHRVLSGDGSWRWIHDRGMVVEKDVSGKPIRLIGTHSDVTDKKTKEEIILKMAYTDALTDLPNRALMNDRLTQAILKASREQSRVALMFVDLDGFKAVNDNHSHEIGDKLLIEVSKRMLSCVRESDTVARLGGDEFVVILPTIETNDDAIKVGQKVLERISEPYTIDNKLLSISASIGIAVYPDHGEDARMLTMNADLAMYVIKHNGKGQVKLIG